MDILIDTKSGVPFYRQIIEQVKFAIARGDIQAGDRLPTVRQLAVDLSINPNTVIRAYREMEIEGVLNTQQGSGTFVDPNPSDGSTWATVPDAGVAEVRRAIEAAQAAFADWSSLKFTERAHYLLKIADAWERRLQRR